MTTGKAAEKATLITRREIIGGITAATIMAPAFIGHMFASGEPIVETTAGKVQGTLAGGIHTFLCVPYGASTEGTGRFMPPLPPKPWAGLRDVPKLRAIAPQTDAAAAPRPNIPALQGMMSIGSEPNSIET